MKRLEEKFKRVAAAVSPCVVAVMSPATARLPRSGHHVDTASGVIISPEGLVLSQWHVSHAKADANGLSNPFEPDKSHRPGEITTVIMHDGRECAAELLGAVTAYDLSLLRLQNPGPYPYAPLKADMRVKVDDWVLKVGHPLGYRRDRPAPVRSGRVIFQTKEGFVTDCLTRAVDSGGPYFDLDGNLAGIINVNDQLKFLLPQDPAFAQRCGDPHSGLTFALANPPIASLLRSMQERELPKPASNGSDSFANRQNDEIQLLRQGKSALIGEWSQGPTALAAYQTLTKSAAASVVTILNGTVPVAFGTVVGNEGHLITKASELPPIPRCRLPDGTIATARVIGVEKAFDLAMLQVESTAAIKPVTWCDTFAPEVGALLASVDADGKPLAAGIVSVQRRDLVHPKTPKHSLPLRVPADWPEIILSTKADGDRVVRKSMGRALAAGIQTDDVLEKMNGRSVNQRDTKEVTSIMRGLISGDLVNVELLRDGNRISLILPLHAEGESGYNFRCDDFPTVIEHALALMPNECGGPLVDLSGRVVGITIARVGNHGCMAIPGDCIQKLLPDFRSGRLADDWKWPRNGRE